MEENKKVNASDFIIVGAGPAGLVSGILLRRLGFVVKIVEKNKNQQRTICGEYLGPLGVEILNELKLFYTISDFERINGMILNSPQEKKIQTHFPEGHFGISLNRQIFQTRLTSEFTSLGGEIFFDNPIDEIQPDSEGYVLKTSQISLKGCYLIGADGRQSKVGRLLGFRTEVPSEKKIALHCYLKPKVPLERFGQMHVLPGGDYIGINPISNQEVNFSMVTTNDSLQIGGGPKSLMNFWINKLSELQRQFHLITSEEIKVTSPLTRKAIEIRRERALLLGDASGFIDPLTGEGMATAIRTAAILNEEIKKCSTIDEAFKNYERRRKEEFKNKEMLNQAFQKIIKSPHLCEVVAQTLGMSKRLRDTFIGVIGNVYDPIQATRILAALYLNER